MANLYSISGFTFNFDDNVVSSSVTSVTCQTVLNVIRDAETSPYGIEESQIANAGGKFNLGGGIYTGISIELLANWQLKFPDFAGPQFIQCFVTDGNLVGGISGNPIAPSSYTQVLQLGAVGGTLAVTTQTSGSAVVDNLVIAQTVWGYPVSGSAVSANTMGEAVTAGGTAIVDFSTVIAALSSVTASNTAQIASAVWSNSSTSILNTISSDNTAIIDALSSVTASNTAQIATAVWTDSGTSVLNNIQPSGVTASTNNIAVAQAVWGFATSGVSVSAGTMGEALSATHQIQIGKWEMIGDQLKLYDKDGTTVLRTFDLFDLANNPSLTGVVKRVPI